MFKVIISLLLLAATANAQDFDANAFCFSCLNYPEQRTYWPFAGDCHKFVQCFYFNETSATGVVQNCPPGTFFHDSVLQCLPEGPVSCQDLCLDDAVQAKGCYGVTGKCSTYFSCANTASYQMCCPTGTSFDASSCSCVTDDTCRDVCTQPPPIPTTENPPQIFDDHCIDSFGATLYPNAADPASYFSFDGEIYITQPCAPGTEFNLQTCRCDILAAEVVVNPNTICEAYFPFDKDFNDYSPSRFLGRKGRATDSTTIDKQVFASGTGSVYFPDANHLGVLVAGLKTYDFGNQASFCFFYQCQATGLPPTCSQTANVLANSNNEQNSECTINFATLPTDVFYGNVSFDRPAGSVVCQGQVNANGFGFSQVCVIANGANVLLYIDNTLISTTPYTPNAHLRIAHCVLNIGYGHEKGAFNGWVDEVLICRRPLSAAEVAAHYDGQDSMRAAKLIRYTPFSQETHGPPAKF